MNSLVFVIFGLMLCAATIVGVVQRNNVLECKKSAIEKNYTPEQIKDICGGNL